MNLIINADDFGLTTNVSKGILYGMQHGVISDTSAIVHTLDFLTSAILAKQQGLQAMGLHCLLTMGEPVLPKERVQSLVNTDGRFFSRAEFMTKELNMLEVKAELKAQIELFLSSGLQCSHIDTHHGFMNHSDQMAQVFQELAEAYQLPLRKETSPQATFVWPKQIFVTEAVYFNHGTPHHTLSDVTKFLKEALSLYHCVEIGCHPGYSDDLLRQISSLHNEREQELALFTSPALSDFINANNIILTSYAQCERGCK